MVMPSVVPHSVDKPFQYWARFEEGYSGNPHAHGLAYTEGNPEFECVLRSDADREIFVEAKRDDVMGLKTWEEAERDIVDYFQDLESEWHPAKDAAGEPLYDFIICRILRVLKQ